MNLSSLLSLLPDCPEYKHLVAQVIARKTDYSVAVISAARPYFAAALCHHLNTATVVIAAQPEGARKFYQQLQIWSPHFISPLLLPHETSTERLRILASLTQLYRHNKSSSHKENNINQDSPPLLLVASTAAASVPTMSKAEFTSASYILQQGMTADPLKLMQQWQEAGYEVSDVVEMPGNMARRGGIIDIFSPASQQPARIEFLGDQIESIRLFDPDSQCSTQIISSLLVVPAQEASAKASVFDYFPADTIIVLDSPREIEAVATKEGKWPELQQNMARWPVLRLETEDAPDSHITQLPFAPSRSYSGKVEMFTREIQHLQGEKERIFVISHQANRLADTLQDQGMEIFPLAQVEQVPPRGSVSLIQGSLPQGWHWRDELNIITDAEIFGFIKQARPARKKTTVASRLSLSQVSPGDYVVHIDHGIGKFGGLTRMASPDGDQEFLVVEYAAGDKLYVPVEQIQRLSRYMGGGARTPSLSRLGTQEWERTKRRVKQSVAEIAHELLQLYSMREVIPGFAFSSDTLWQQELESSFPYAETPDQIEAIMAVKQDMEQAKPMDRLICGDVGYGKTEVALRAAFKAIMDNKQVAMLVPTTVLAQQHFVTFKERLQSFPLTVEALSRFCSPQQEQDIIAGLAQGKVDICIGTHRLLQQDIMFSNLGLVIIDEEQRFGVAQKEKLKKMRSEVDTLTLSATPIPRTLHMAVTGIRDMNAMQTPPEERLAVKTHVGIYDEALVRQAIIKELDRNGQVFYLHNRIRNIDAVADRLQSLVPEARIAIAHGRMAEDNLERVMTDFIAGKYDILVTTTIIQLGLDIPNVNTLIVNQADKFGLAQLYQLRGRVGRGINQAYAYFLYQQEKGLTSTARQRLRTIAEASELGAGLEIAMRDMEIRGAGNLLGAKQSGHIAELGFDLYCQLLAESVEELKIKQAGKPPARKVHPAPSINLPLSSYIPQEYAPQSNTRLNLYHRLAQITDVAEVEKIAQELKDRFGALPSPVSNLLYIIKIKALALKAGVEFISTREGKITIKFGRVRDLSIPKNCGKGITLGATQIKLDTQQQRTRWTKQLEQILQNMAQTSA